MVSVNNGQQGSAGGNGDHAAIQNDSLNADAGGNQGPSKSRGGDQKNRSNRPPPARRTDSKPKETLVNGTTA